jgi:hypothetical protein
MKTTAELYVKKFKTEKQFAKLVDSFRKEFEAELKSIKAKLIDFKADNHSMSGYFTKNERFFYFQLSDVRIKMYGAKLLVKETKDAKHTSGIPKLIDLKVGMLKKSKLF